MMLSMVRLKEECKKAYKIGFELGMEIKYEGRSIRAALPIQASYAEEEIRLAFIKGLKDGRE